MPEPDWDEIFEEFDQKAREVIGSKFGDWEVTELEIYGSKLRIKIKNTITGESKELDRLPS